MSHILIVLMILAMLAVLASLLVGLIAMARGGAVDARYANKLMRLRVAFQGLALVLFVLAMIAS